MHSSKMNLLIHIAHFGTIFSSLIYIMSNF